MEEKELIEKARKWFEHKYGNNPKDVGMDFIKVWHKIMPFHTREYVIFAPSQKLADHFSFLQNAMWGAISYFWIIIPFSIIAFTSGVFYQNIVPLIVFLSVCLAFMVFYLVLSVIGKKWEKEYIGNIIVCHVDDLQYFDEDIEEDI